MSAPVTAAGRARAAGNRHESPTLQPRPQGTHAKVEKAEEAGNDGDGPDNPAAAQEALVRTIRESAFVSFSAATHKFELFLVA